MNRPLIDRLTDTPGFRALLALASVLVLPVLALGLLFSPFYLAAAVAEPRAALNIGAVVALALGGAVGLAGWGRALVATKGADRQNLMATMVCLLVGIATALAVTGYLVTVMVDALDSPGGAEWQKWQMSWAAMFAIAHLVWAVAGWGAMQRLARLYSERRGRAFDAIPLTLLIVALGLALTVMFVSATL